MKIGLYTPHFVFDDTISGAVILPQYLRQAWDILKGSGYIEHELEIIVPLPPKKRAAKHPLLEGVHQINVDDSELLELLLAQDIVIVGNTYDPRTSKDQTWWQSPLFESEVPFVTWVHNEIETKREMGTMTSEPGCAGVILCCSEMFEVIEEHLNGKPTHEAYPVFTEDRTHLVKEKDSVVASLCRVTNVKRLPELVTIAPRLLEAGLEIAMYGQQHNHWEVRKIKQMAEDAGIPNPLKGAVDWPDRFSVMDRIMYFWNPSYRMRPPWTPRIDVAVAEAISAGCVPILHAKAVPPGFVDGQNCFLLDPDNPGPLIDNLLQATQEDRERMVADAWRIVDTRIQAIPVTKRLVRFLERLVSSMCPWCLTNYDCCYCKYNVEPSHA